MGNLKEKLLTETQRPAVIRDCARLVDEEVERKSGFSGLAIKAAFKTVKTVKPGFIEHVIDGLLDAWVEKLEGHFAKWQEGGSAGNFGVFCQRDSSAVAERLLEVTDARAHKIEQKTVASLYGKMRPSAKEHVVAAVPGLGRVVDKYLSL